MPPANSARRSMNVLPWDVVRRLCGILLVLLATLGLSGTLSLSAAVDKFEGTWREFRIPPFEVIAENDTRELRAFLGDLFQYRYLLRRVLPIEGTESAMADSYLGATPGSILGCVGRQCVAPACRPLCRRVARHSAADSRSEGGDCPHRPAG
jgi:hypothetical protein